MSETQAPTEAIITRILHQRLEKEQKLSAGDRESVAYRISEIMVCAKDLYTHSLPRLLQEGTQESNCIEEEITGLRMALLHLRDLVTDFDNTFLEAMTHEREANPDEVYDKWEHNSEAADQEWTAEELGLAPEDWEREEA